MSYKLWNTPRRFTWQPHGLDLEESFCTIDNVIEAVCFYFDMPEWKLYQATRKREIVDARHYAHYFSSINREYSLNDIGSVTKKDHATVRASILKIEEWIQCYPSVKDIVFTIAFYIKWLNQLEMEITRHEVTRQQIRQLYFLLDQLGIRHLKQELVQDASNGRTESARELTHLEMLELLRHLANKLKDAKADNRPAKQAYQQMDRMRKRILSICYSIGWTRFNIEKRRHEVDMERLEAWLVKYGYLHKKLNDYTYLELPALVTQAERLLATTLDEKPSRI